MANAARPMSKTQLIAHLADNLEITKKQAGEFLACLTETAYNEASRGFTIPGIGKLILKDQPARMARNPRTQEMVKVPAKTVVKFRVAKACKELVEGQKKKK